MFVSLAFDSVIFVQPSGFSFYWYSKYASKDLAVPSFTVNGSLSNAGLTL